MKVPETFPFYRPSDGKAGDVMPCFMNDRFYIYYLRFCERPDGNYNEWSVFETKDFVHYSDDVRIGLRGGTGCVIYHDGLYHAYKQHHNKAIAHYVGKTPYSFELHDASLFSDDDTYVNWAWRDPKIYWIEEEQCFWMLVSTNRKTNNLCERTACVALCKSTDLFNWKVCAPLFAPMALEGTYECADLLHIGQWYYLMYSNANHNKKTRYVKSRSMYGPWEIPDDDTLDSFMWYAGRAATDGKRHIAVAWNPDRTGEDLSPKFGLRDVEKTVMQTSVDYSPLGYAGNMVFHELKQADNGDLLTVPVSEMVAAYTKRVENSFVDIRADGWNTQDDAVNVDATGRYAALLMQEVPEEFLLRCVIKADNVKEVGIAIDINEQFTLGHYIVLQPSRNRMIYRSGRRERGGFVGYCFPWEVELEKPISPDSDGLYHVTMMCKGECATVYVNGAALSLRMDRSMRGKMGLFVYNGAASITQIQLLTR